MPSKSVGFTLVELLAMLALLGIIVTFGVTSFGTILEKQRLQQAVESVVDIVRLARTESVIRNSDFFVSIVSGTSWCAGLDDTAACTCSTASSCQVDGIDKMVSAGDFGDVEVATTSLAQFKYDSSRGLPETTAGANLPGDQTYEFTNDAGTVQVQLNAVGRVRICTTTSFGNYKAC